MRLPAGSVLYRAGDECGGFVIVREGTIRVTRIGESGREIVLYRVRPGGVCLQTFGCLANGSRYSAEAVTETEVAIEVVPPTEYRRRLAEDEAFRGELMAAVAARFAELEQLVEDIAMVGIDARLARALLRLMDRDGVVVATHEQIATEIGSVREVVSRHLRLLAQAGVIQPARRHIRVCAKDTLATVAAV